jgi:DNA-binding Lrp family transcriptional regulator
MPIRDIHRGPLVRNPQLLEAGRDADLSGLDGALVARLQVDGRASFAQLSRDFRVTEKTVRRRIAELRENGLIEITTVVDPAILGYRQAAFIGIKVDASRRASEVAEDVFRVPAADYAVRRTSDRQLSWSFVDVRASVISRSTPIFGCIISSPVGRRRNRKTFQGGLRAESAASIPWISKLSFS